MFKSACTVLVDVDVTVIKFYASANAILSHVKYASEMSKLFLVETFCLPVLSYSCESLNLSRKQLSQLNVCWNNTHCVSKKVPTFSVYYRGGGSLLANI